MNKIAIIANGSINDRKGFLNAVINRVKNLSAVATCQIDSFLISSYEPPLVRYLHKSPRIERAECAEADGFVFKQIWQRFSLFDYLLRYMFRKRPLLQSFINKQIAKRFAHYNLINCHSFDCGLIALEIWKRYHVPYVITWHGSDIHTEPFKNEWVRKNTIEIIENAACNFFVSQALMETSDELTRAGRKELLYNGVGDNFFPYPDEERNALKHNWGVEDKKVVIFCGGFVAVKNVFSLPEIFRHIYDEYPHTAFWLVGDGKYRAQLAEAMKGLPVHFWGNQAPNEIPKFMNVADVLVLPSFNEGLPLVTVEALSCGCHVVGSDRGGIPEAIGRENCVQIGTPEFASRIAQKVLYYLNGGNRAILSDKIRFSWKETAKKEIAYIGDILN